MEHYYRINLPQRNYQPIYSVDEVEELFREKMIGNELRTLFVSGYAMEERESYGNVDDFIMMGGELLIAFKTFTLALIIHAEGLMAYCVFPAIREMGIDALREGDDETAKNVFYDLEQVYSKYDFGLEVKDMSFDTVEYPAFSISQWDMERIRASKKLPARLSLDMEDLEMHFCGSAIEYFYIVTKGKESE